MRYARDFDGRGGGRPVFAKFIVVEHMISRVPPGSCWGWEVLIKSGVRGPALTPRPHKPGTMSCVLAKLIALEYEFRCRRSPVFLRILTFESPWIGMETRTVLTELVIWSVRGDPVLVSPFLYYCCRDHGHGIQRL